MTSTLVLTPIFALLAFLGYVWLLSFRFWVGIVLTLTIAYQMAVSLPSDNSQVIYWGVATGVFATALFAMSFLPEREMFVIEVRAKKKTSVKPETNIVIDGTNVIFWGGDASLGTLREVVDHLREKAIMPYVFFDASSRHLLRDATLDERAFAKALDLPKERIMVCPGQTQADDFILKFAREQNLAVVSNDQFRDRANAVAGLKLVKGVVADGYPVLEDI
jgi:hypothetical protein